MTRSKRWQADRKARQEADRKARRDMARAAESTQAWIDENRALGGVCDFCSTPFGDGPVFTWNTGEPIVGELSGLFQYREGGDLGAASLPIYYSPLWGACATCDSVVAERDPEQLALHVIAHRSRERLGDVVYERPDLQTLVELYRVFFERAKRKEVQ